MRTFTLRDERIIGDIKVIYLSAPDENWTQEAFEETCQYCVDKEIKCIDAIAEVLINTHEFNLLEITDSFILQGEHPDEEEYYNTLKESDYIK